MMLEIIQELGYDGAGAATEAEAVTMAQAERPDVMLLDMVLPDASGTKALEHLRHARPDVPIIMVTANADEEVARETLKRGAFDYVMKSVNIPQLARVLEAALAASGG